MAGLPPMSKRDQSLVLVGVLVLAAAAAYWYFLWSPAAEQLDLLEARVARLDSLNATAKKEAQAGKLEQLKREVERANQSLGLMRQLVPTGNEVPALLDQVNVAAKQAGIEVTGVKPAGVIPGDQFDTHKYSMSLLGNYHQVVRFFADVGSLTRIMTPVGVSATPKERPASSRRPAVAGEQTIGVDFELQTFVSKTPGSSPGDGK